MLQLIIISLYFVLPAYGANMAPVIFAKLGWLKFLNQPIDGGKKWGRDYLFGQNKTWRGLVAAVIVGLIIAFIQSLLFDYPSFTDISIINYPASWIIFGALAGLGAILGDLAKSFFKRRVGIKSGGVWPVFDQLDFIVGFLVFTYFIAFPGWQIILTIIIFTLILHPLTNIIGYLIGWKKVWW
jgi:CDP-2,3-bis-(O-geranylgeranyl)-sn-glycerol synthase